MADKKIGILFGMENTFPPALVEKINSMKVDGVEAEFVKIGGIRMDEPKKYAVIIDRISQDIPFYRAYLKNAILQGTIIINNPFWWTADDKFFNYAMAHKIGVAIPPTYTQAELKAICERRGGWWHDDDLMGGFCEYQSAGLQAP